MSDNHREKAQLEQRDTTAAPAVETALVITEVAGRDHLGRISAFRKLDEVPGLADALRGAMRLAVQVETYHPRRQDSAAIPWALYEALCDAAAPLLQEGQAPCASPSPPGNF